MTTKTDKAVSLTSYLVGLPPLHYLVFVVLLLGLVFGLFICYVKSIPLTSTIIESLLVLVLPALLLSFLVKLTAWRVPYRRIIAAALVGEILYSIAYAASLLLFPMNPFWAEYVLLIGAALVSVFWWLAARYLFMLEFRSILFAALQLLLHLFFLTGSSLYVSTEPFADVALRFYLSSIVLGIIVRAFISLLNAPAQRNLGFKSVDGFSYLMAQWFDGTTEIEKLFEKMGESNITMVNIMGFKRKNDSILFLTPFLHFGPVGNIGGSQFPQILADEIEKKHGSKTFIFHGTACPDMNPVSSSEVTKIMKSVDDSIMGAEYKDAKVSISLGQMEECKAQALRVNDSAMISLTRAPNVTEDISLGLGLAMTFHAEKNLDKAMIVDQHNAEGDLLVFEAGSHEGFRYLGAITDALSKNARKMPLRVGASFRDFDSPMVGGAGIKVAVFSTKPEYVLVLIDCNGIEPNFRDHLESEVKKLGRSMGREFAVGIFTTDTHTVNLKAGGVNPLTVGDDITAAIKEACKEAALDMQKATYFADRRWFEVKVTGAHWTAELISTVNSVIAVAKITLPFIVLGSLILLFVIAARL